MRNELLDGFYLQELLVEPLTGKISGVGEGAHLPSKSIEVLLYLARRPRALVSREELLGQVWGDGNGSNELLSHAVGEIRHALGDHADHPVFVQTVPKRGYRLLVEARPAGSPPAAVNPYSDDAVPAQFWIALMKHGVVQAGIAYLVFGWLLIQVADVTFANLGLPPWAMPVITFTVVGGFPVVVILAWFIEVTGGRMIRDHGAQSGGVLQALGRNYLAIVAAYAIAGFGAGVYQFAIGFRVPEQGAVAVADAPALIPVEPNSIAVLQLLNIDGSDRSRVFSDGLGEDVLDQLAKIRGLRVSSRGDAWSLPPNASSDIVRRRLRVAYYLEGSVRLVEDNLRVVVQLIDSQNGFHIVSRSFDRELQDFMAVQKEITGLTIANMRVALPEDTQLLVTSSYDDTNLDAYVLYRRGKAIMEKPRTAASLREARRLFEQSLAVDPGYAAARAELCAAYVASYVLSNDSADIDAAERACGAALAESSQLHMVHTALGRLYLATGRTADAEKEYGIALQINSQDVPALQGLATAYRRQQRNAEAERLLHQATDLQPGNWNSINRLGNFLFGLGRYTEAADEYRKVVYLDADNWVTLGNLGGALMMAGDFEAALPVIKQSLGIETNQTIYSNLGIIYYYLGQFDESVAIHRKVTELSPNSSYAWLNLADALHFSGDEAAARQAYERSAVLSKRSLRVNPADPVTLYTLAWATAMTGDTDAAREYMSRSVKIAPDDPYARYYDALLKANAGDDEGALDAVKLAVEMGYPVKMLVAEPFLQRLAGNDRFEKIRKKGERK